MVMNEKTGLSYESLHRDCHEYFSALPDHRASNASTLLSDHFMSAMAMFQLKYPSMLTFGHKTKAELNNTRRLFHIRAIPSDTTLRQTLDGQSPQVVRPMFEQAVKRLEKSGKLENFKVLGGYYLVPMDGVEFFSSKEVHCDHCQRKNLSNGTTQYSHAMLCCCVVSPGTAQVVPLGGEPINRQDGASKNDHELCAAKRLWEDLWERYPGRKFLHGGDALFANAPLVRLTEKAGQKYILNTKPDSHETLFGHFNDPRNKYAYEKASWTEGGEHIVAKWCNNLPLNNSAPDVRTNAMFVTLTDKKGKPSSFSWVTNIKISPKNIKTLVQCGRSRWKIENETFNTLKNQGYRFEHNFGHGKKHLSNLLALLMLLAFLIDQVQHIASREFKKALACTRSKTRLWEEFRAVFRFFEVNSFSHLMKILIANHLKSGP
jgi:hypothetical protein